MTGPDADTGAVGRVERGRFGWAHRSLLPTDLDGEHAEIMSRGLADLWFVHLVGAAGEVTRFTIEVTTADSPNTCDGWGGYLPEHGLWVTRQPDDDRGCSWSDWQPGATLVRFEYGPVESLRDVGLVYSTTAALVVAALDHGPVVFTDDNVARLVQQHRGV